MGGITHLAMSPDNPFNALTPYYAITRNGNAYAWGANHNNQLGLDHTCFQLEVDLACSGHVGIT